MPWIAAAAAIGGALLGASASKSAASKQAAATRAAIAEQARQFDITRADQAPFRETGVSALTRLRNLMGLDPGVGGELDRRFTVDDFWGDPVTQLSYQSGLDEGMKALRARAPLTTGIDSGAALKELTKFATDYTGQRAGEAEARFEGRRSNVFNRLMALIGGGQVANQVNANAGMTTASNIGNLLTANANAQGAARIAGANAIGGGLSSIANWWNQNAMLDKILNRGGVAGSPPIDLYSIS